MYWLITRLPALRDRLPLAAVLVFASAVFLTGIHWGLPSRQADVFLFGNRTPWTGAEIQAAIAVAGIKDDPNRGADLDADPVGSAAVPVLLNTDDAARAQIVRRYRLFTYQPDEMITLMSLAKMRPAKFDLDPRLYQYGGLWIYPVGLLLRAAGAVGYVELRGGPDALTYYLDHPELFARFYVVARLYVAMWGVVAAWAVYAIVRQITTRRWVATLAAIAFCCMPVVVNMAHEAKPHVPGVALILLTVLAGAKFVESGRLSHALVAATLSGCAVGMVLSAVPALIVPVVMVLLRPMPWGDRLRLGVFCVLLAGFVYGLTNPYVAYHLLSGGEVLRSNLGNSKAFYSVGRVPEGAVNVGRLLAAGAGPYVAALGAVAAIGLGIRAVQVRRSTDPDEVARRAHGLLLAAPALMTLAQATLVAAGKPGEFARFLLLTHIFLLVEVFAWIGLSRTRGGQSRVFFGIALVAATAMAGWPYLRAFVRDASGDTTRLRAASAIAAVALSPDDQPDLPLRLLLPAEPAPYSVPPVDLWKWQLVKVPAGATDGDDGPFDSRTLGVLRVGDGATPIGWADKPISIEGLSGAPGWEMSK
jgi:hypothetical protein